MSKKKKLSAKQYVAISDVANNQADAELVLHKRNISYSLSNGKFSGQRSVIFPLVITDALLILWDHITILTLLMAAALRWTWPPEWLRSLHGLFILNLDIYNFDKVNLGAFVGTQNVDISSNLVKVTLWSQELLVFGILLALFTLFAFLKLFLRHRQKSTMRKNEATLRRIGILILQIVTIPIGAAGVARLFHCNVDGLLADDNKIMCWKGGHWAYLIPSTSLYGFLICVFPTVWLFQRIHHECGSGIQQNRHEVYMCLKEMEYSKGLDDMWQLRDHYLFASFSGLGRYCRVFMHTGKISLVLIYATLHHHTKIQAAMFCAVLFFGSLSILIIRPFRLMSFNTYASFSLACLGSTCILGALRASFTPYSMRSVFLTDSYCSYILTILEGLWLLSTIIFFIYLFIIYKTGKIQLAHLAPNSMRYIRSLLHARLLVEHCRWTLPILAPVHELSHQILLLNALRTEAEWCQDPLAEIMWTRIEELTHLYHHLGPKSLFGLSVKSDIRKTAAEVVALAPQLAKRMHQREYDFSLVQPVRRRMLFKMHCLAILTHGVEEARARLALRKARQNTLWPAEPKAQLNHGKLRFDNISEFTELYPTKTELIEVEPGVKLEPKEFLHLENIREKSKLPEKIDEHFLGSSACLLEDSDEEEIEHQNLDDGSNTPNGSNPAFEPEDDNQ